MDVKAYIESGVLESVAMGTATDQEMRAAQCLSKIYPEIKEALNIAESDLEDLGRVYAVKPPTNLRDKILAEVSKHEQDPILSIAKDSQEETIDTPIKTAPPIAESKESSNSWAPRLAWAAAILAFVFAAWQFTNSNQKSERIAELESQNSTLTEENQQVDMQLAEANSGIEEMFKPEITKIVMSSVMDGVTADISVFWDTENGEVKLDPRGLPEIPSDKQYQLWALKDGKPINMGVIPKDASGALMASKSTLVADAFALTIEPLGGQETPSLDQLIVLGALS